MKKRNKIFKFFMNIKIFVNNKNKYIYIIIKILKINK